MTHFKNKKAQQLYYIFEIYNAVKEIETETDKVLWFLQN
jgi:hypothetical protein